MLDLCLDETLCDVFEIDLPTNFILTGIEIDASATSLSHFCSCNIYLDGGQVYQGPMGKEGFVMEIDSLLPAKKIKITTDCGTLSEWISETEPCRIKVRGYFFAQGEPEFNTAFAEVWE